MVRKPWNAEVLYGPGPRREQAWLRAVFLLEIETYFPEVLAALKESVYEKWRSAAMLLYQNRTPEDIAGGVDRLMLWDRVKTARSPECKSASDALDQWAERDGLARTWALDEAVDSMGFWSWKVEHGPDSEPIPVNEIEKPLSWIGSSLQTFRRLSDAPDSTPLAAWDPGEETLAAFRERVERNIEKQQRWCRKMGCQPIKQRRKSRGRSIEVRMWWLALRKIKNLNCEQIADKEQLRRATTAGERSGKELAISGSGVLKAITELENQLGLDPELSKRT